MNQNNSGFLSSIPPLTRNILIINVLVWLAQFVLLRQDFDLAQYLGLHYFGSGDFQIYQLITYMFLHDPTSIGHVFFNMFAVFMFGRVLESIWGAKRFGIFYLLAGIGAGLTQILVAYIRIKNIDISASPEIMNEIQTRGLDLVHRGLNYSDLAMGQLNALVNGATVGASGAVFGILVAFGMIFPNVELMLIFPPIPIKAKWFVIGYGAMELFLGFGNFAGDSVAHFAHLGGLLTGLALLLYWKKKGTLYGNLRRY